MRRNRAILFAVTIACTLYAVADFAWSANAVERRTLVYSHFTNAGSLNPHLYTPNQMYAQEMLYEPLVATDRKNAIVPCLAKSWSVSDCGLFYTFHLRDDVVFSDGEKFDAHAVEKNFTAIMANRNRHSWLELVNKIDSFRAVDDLTFELALNEPYYPTLIDLSLPRPFRFLSPASIPESGNTADGILSPAGTGPWVLAETVLGEHDVFEKSQTYWGRKPHFDRVIVKVIPDPLSRAMALRTGEIDLIYGEGQIPIEVFAALRKDQRFTTMLSPPMGGMAAAINTKRFPTNELPVRQAIQYLTNKDELVDGVFLNTQPKADFLFSPDLPFCNVGLEPYAHDPDKAKRLLDEAGWKLDYNAKFRSKNGKTLTIEFCYIGNDPIHKAIAEVLQGQAARVGVQLILVGEEEDSFLRRQHDGEFGMILNPTWGPPFEPHTMLGSMRSPAHADYQAQSGLAMKIELDEAITVALRTQSDKEHERLYKTILSTLHKQAVYLPLNYSCLLAVYPKGMFHHFEFGPGKTKYPFEQLRKGK